MKIDAPWLVAGSTQAVCGALMDHGFQAFFVGGCVRNALIGAPVSDIDIATDALPEEVVAAAQKAELKAIPTGIEHGTITIVAGGVPHEVTTFRADMETDGRHAKVQFSRDIATDAARRDFTMNAIYATPEGAVVDPLGGIGDLKDRRVRFIGDAGARICEDYLRSLRFFRFTAWYGDPDLGIDAEGLAAVADNLDGIGGLSKERVSSEILKLLSAPDPARAVAAMRSSGVLATVLPHADDRALALLVHLEQTLGVGVDGLRRLAVIAGPSDDLRLSKVQRTGWASMRDAAGDVRTALHLGYRLGAARAIDALLVRAALMEQEVPAGALADAARGAQAVFPIRAADLPELKGKALGDTLKALEADWIASGFALDREALLS